MAHSYSLVLSDSEVAEIYDEYMRGATLAEIGRKFYCNKGTIRKVLDKYSPGCLRRRGPRDRDFRKRIISTMPNSTAVRIYGRYLDGEPPALIAEEYRISRSAVWRVIHAVEAVARHRGLLKGEPYRQRRHDKVVA